MNKGQEVIKCNRCGSNKVIPSPIILALFVATGCLLWIPVIGWILAPLTIIAIFVMMVLQVGKRTMMCQDCKNQFVVEAETYKEYKKALK